MPEESLVGIMLESEAPVYVAMSSASGLDQHSAFTWEVDEELADFVYLPNLPEATKATADIAHMALGIR